MSKLTDDERVGLSENRFMREYCSRPKSQPKRQSRRQARGIRSISYVMRGFIPITGEKVRKPRLCKSEMLAELKAFTKNNKKSLVEEVKEGLVALKALKIK